MTTASGSPAGDAKPLPRLTPKLAGTRNGALYWCVVGVLATVMLMAGVLSLAFNVLALGPVGFVIAVIGAVVPVPLYLGLFLWLDRFEPEPPGLLVLAFFWGATVSILVAGCLNTVFGLAVNAILHDAELSNQLMASFSAPLMEETLKGSAVLLLFLFKSEHFDGVLDGIIYAGVTALGFAMAENIQYYGGAMQKGGVMALGVTVILRGVMSPYTHVLFTSMTGIGFGLAVSAKNPLLKVVLPVIGWMVAMSLHFLWNTIPALGERALGGGGGTSLLVLLGSYFVFWVPVFGVLIGLVFWSLRRESKMITTELGHYVESGELTKEEAGMLARLWPRMSGMGVGPAQNTPWGVRRKYTRLATALAFYRHRVATGHTKANAEEEAFQLAELRMLRGAHGFPAQARGNAPG